MSPLRIRRLTQGEERLLRKEEAGKISFKGPLSIIGRADHPYVCSTIHSDSVKMIKMDLGGGQFVNELMGSGPAEGGITIRLSYKMGWQAGAYVFDAASALNIPTFFRLSHGNLTYFPSRYEQAIADCYYSVDAALMDYYQRRSILSRCFGSIHDPDWNSGEAKRIRAIARAHLSRFK